jgi:cell wall-associated NlpC family hydrolase
VPTHQWPRSGRKRRLGSIAAVCAVSTGAVLGLSGTASAAAPSHENTQQAPVSVVQAAANAGTTSVVTVSSTKSKGQRIVDATAAQSGKPYVWGATGPNSFDCSGLTQFVHKQLGIDLPRTAAQQRAALKNIAKPDMAPGDLIFFADGGKVYHVGVYAGENKMWAAPEPGDHVKLQKIWSSSYSVGRAW